MNDTKSIINFKAYGWQHWVTLLVFLSALLMLYFAANSFINTNAENIRDFLLHEHNLAFAVVWVFGPPAWFFIEYFLLWSNADEAKKKNLKAARELAQPFWAAALYFLFLLVPK